MLRYVQKFQYNCKDWISTYIGEIELERQIPVT